MGRVDSSALMLSPRHREMLMELLERFVPQADVWAYGSRVNGDCHEASDLDLVVHGAADLEELKEALVESNLPIRVEVLAWERIPESFRREIERAYVVVQTGVEGNKRA